MPLPSTKFSQLSQPFNHPRLNIIACFALLDEDVSDPRVVVSNEPACSLSESSAEDELELDLFDSVSQVGDSLARFDGGCRVKKCCKSMDIVPRSLYHMV